jgi:hypothetical protein
MTLTDIQGRSGRRQAPYLVAWRSDLSEKGTPDYALRTRSSLSPTRTRHKVLQAQEGMTSPTVSSPELRCGSAELLKCY